MAVYHPDMLPMLIADRARAIPQVINMVTSAKTPIRVPYRPEILSDDVTSSRPQLRREFEREAWRD